jgi:5-methyltetrahydrofolate--homocysteine methyltransferase
VREFGLGMVGGCCGTTPEHMPAVVERLAPFRTANAVAIGGRGVDRRVPTEREAGIASLYDHVEDRRKVTELLKPERMGVVLRDELMLHPEQSTDAFVFHHPEAKYFKV